MKWDIRIHFITPKETNQNLNVHSKFPSKMKKLLILTLLIYTSLAVKSQDSTYIETRKYIQKVSIQFPGISGEFNILPQKAISLNPP